MILILTYQHYEQGTDAVVEWLLHQKEEFIKITIDDLASLKNDLDIDVTQNKIFYKGIDLINDIHVIWYRRFNKKVELQLDEQCEKLNSQLEREANVELSFLADYLFTALQGKKWMPNYKNIDVNKLEVTAEAHSLGILVPKTKILKSKSSLLDFYQDCNERIITKPIHHSGYFVRDNFAYSAYTTSITKNQILEGNETFFPSLFQERVEGDFEIRTFFMANKFYSTAILVNDNSNKNVDIKLNYQNKKNIAWVPYSLPEEYEANLIKLMHHLQLNTGSIDTIKTKDNKYYFLEVNPVGQYSAPAQRCNYNVEREIASWLAENNNPCIKN
ncbi:grasp-with-spasm system ATP-grasp peptide maturase [Hymenobacter canadensis]|uniref:Grasp-with-spasm system ATP-grasp peptide maturase n=1 Tax=Hymenobacter canadensis TaxID=2999067 RepID=A0ABY7LWG5_9BACT|nr:grasp-with-spasm system ATP-grasp peptide maturase [Hymenobacter canadensis]WBA44262.1 grasp-with-spasm system ATP-grasp peptide maturase [Hymenobacter canadensis]